MQVFDVGTQRSRIIDLSAGSPTLSPFVDDFTDGSIAFVQATEASLGEDIDDDGNADDVVVLLAADFDEDGALDDADVCITVADDGGDADLDAIGDGCDATPFCSDFVSASPPVAPSASAAACQKAIGKAVAKFFKARVKASQKCLGSLAAGKLGGDPVGLCIGGLVNGVDTAPSEPKTAAKIAKAKAKLDTAFDKSCGFGSEYAALDTCAADTTPNVAACTATGAGGAAANVLRQAYGSLGAATPTSARKCQKAVGGAAAKYVLAVAKAQGACLDEINDGLAGNPQAVCLGSLDDVGGVALPSDPKTSAGIDDAELALRDDILGACSGGELGSLDTCGANPTAAGDCLVCTAWRNAAELIRVTYGPQ
jgi:hypothetical protein